MNNAVIAQGLARQIERPDIHRKVEKLSSIQVGYPPAVAEMVRDLKENVPGISIRQLSGLVGVSVTVVQKALSDTTVEMENWTDEDNPASAASELAALHEHHPDGYRDDVSYVLWDGSAADTDEWQNVPVLFTAPPPSDPHRRADQSHTIKRPITLATHPFEVAA